MSEVSTWSVFTFLTYTLAVFLLAIFSHRLLKGRSFLSEYFLGSRGLGVWALAMSYAATSASGGSFTGFPALIYEHGWILALWISSYMMVPVTCMAFLGKRLNQVARKSGAITVPDVLRDRFDAPGLGILVSLMLAIFLAANLVAQFKAGGVILQILMKDQAMYSRAAENIAWIPKALYFGDPAYAPSAEYCLGLLLFAGGVILYTSYGGFRAVVWTDVLQGIVMFFGVLILLPLAIGKAGGMEAVTRTLAAQPVTRTAEIYLAPTKNADRKPITLTHDMAVHIRHEDSEHVFTIIEPITIPPDEDRPSVVLFQAVEPKTLPPDGWTGLGNNVRIEEATTAKRVRVLEFRVAPRRTLVAGPGPSSREFDGFLPLGLALSFTVMWAISGAGQPGTMVRLMAFETTKVYRRSIFLVTFYFGLIYLPLVFIFVCARTLFDPPLSEPDQVMARTITLVAPPMLAGLLLAAPFAAIMSTVDSFLLMISSSLVRDIYQRSINPNVSPRAIRYGSYTTTAVVGVVVTLGALNPPRFLQDLIILTTAGLACCFLAPMLLCLYWKRATAVGVAASMIGGFFTLVGLYAVNWIQAGSIGPFNLFGILPVVWGLLVSFVAGILGSLVSEPPPADRIHLYFSAAPKGTTTEVH